MSSTTAAGPKRLSDQLAQVVVEVGGEQLDIADLVLLGLLGGEWQAFEQRVRTGLAAAPGAVSRSDVSAAATAFRYQHGLISARDFMAWLTERSLTPGSLSGALQRALLGDVTDEPNAETMAPGTDGRPVSEPDDLEAALWADAVCSRLLERLCAAGADLLIAADYAGADSPTAGTDIPTETIGEACASVVTGLASLGEENLRARLTRLAQLIAAQERLRARLAEDQDELTRCLSEHSLEWLRIQGEGLAFTTEGAAREARLMITDDGADTATVAAQAGDQLVSCPGAGSSSSQTPQH